MTQDLALPRIGFGTFPMRGEECYRAVRSALDLGYRLIDTAAHYRNEEEVGRAIRDSGIDRDELIVGSKMFGADQPEGRTRHGFEDSLARLGLDRLDYYLIHWPMPRIGTYRAAYRQLVEVRDEGRLRLVGVSNFAPPHLRQVIEDTGVVPALNQIQLHPAFSQAELRAVHAELGITTQAWAPLGPWRGVVGDAAPTGTVVDEIASRHGATWSQVVIAWHLAIGTLPIPKSSGADRQRDNLAGADLVLGPDEVAAVSAIDRGEHPGIDVETFEEFD